MRASSASAGASLRALRIPPGSKNSGLGRVADNYYHFLIDFAVKLFNECGLPTQLPSDGSAASVAAWRRRCVVYVQRHEGSAQHKAYFFPGELSLFHPVREQARRFDELFGGRLTLQHVSLADLDRRHKFRNVTLRNWRVPNRFGNGTIACRKENGSATELAPNSCSEWSRQPPLYFERFRRAVLSGALGASVSANAVHDGHEDPDGPVTSTVLLIDRTNRSTKRLAHRNNLGARTILPELWNGLKKWAADAPLSHRRLRIVDNLGNISVGAQARLFHSAHIVIANHGAACSNVIFCQPGAHFIELPPIIYACYRNLAVRSGVHYHAAATQDEVVPLVETILREERGREGHRGYKHSFEFLYGPKTKF